MARRFSLKLETTKGKIHDFSATVGEQLVISGDGMFPRAYTRADLPDTPTRVRVSAVGVPGSEYTIAVDLPDVGNDFVWKYRLDAPIQEVEFDV